MQRFRKILERSEDHTVYGKHAQGRVHAGTRKGWLRPRGRERTSQFSIDSRTRENPCFMQISLAGTSNKLFARLSPFIGTQVHTACRGREAPGIICRCWRRKCDQIFAGNSPERRINIYWTSRNLRCNPMRSISLQEKEKKMQKDKGEGRKIKKGGNVQRAVA